MDAMESRSRFSLWAIVGLFLSVQAHAQTGCGTVSQCPVAHLPLAGNELLYIVQGGLSKQIGISNFIGQNILPLNNTFTGSNLFAVGDAVVTTLAGVEFVPGLIGDGTTVNNTLMQSLVSSIAANGELKLPCGVFKLTTSITLTVPSGDGDKISGSGQDCTVLYFSGSNGLAITEANQFSSFNLSDMTIETDDTSGSYTAVAITNATTRIFTPTIGGATTLHNVLMRGVDSYSTVQDYWSIGLSDSNVSQVTVDRGGYQGANQSSVYKGTAILAAGVVSPASYLIVINIAGFQAQYCNIGYNQGDYVQGVTITGGTNFTQCNYGVFTIASPVGTPDELTIADSQIESSTIGISAIAMNDLNVHHNTIIVDGGTGIVGAGNKFAIDHNQMQSSGGVGTYIGINISFSSTNGGSINDNVLQNFATGIENTGSTTSIANTHDNQMVSVTTPYNNVNGASGFRISDPGYYLASTIGTSVPSCAVKYDGARTTILDQCTTTFGATVNAGSGGCAGGIVVAICNGTNYTVH